MGKTQKLLNKKLSELTVLRSEIKDLEEKLGQLKNPIPSDIVGKVVRIEGDLSLLHTTTYVRLTDIIYEKPNFSHYSGICVKISKEKRDGNEQLWIDPNYALLIDWEDWEDGLYSIVSRQEFDELLEDWLERNADILNRE